MEKYRPTKYTDMSNNDEPVGKTLLSILLCPQGSGCPSNLNPSRHCYESLRYGYVCST